MVIRALGAPHCAGLLNTTHYLNTTTRRAVLTTVQCGASPAAGGCSRSAPVQALAAGSLKAHSSADAQRRTEVAQIRNLSQAAMQAGLLVRGPCSGPLGRQAPRLLARAGRARCRLDPLGSLPSCSALLSLTPCWTLPPRNAIWGWRQGLHVSVAGRSADRR